MADAAEHQKQVEEFGSKNDFWLFGYGSLIWKPPPHYDQRIPGYIEGYVRRFWQASEDHRGTPSAPGRVVTLITREHWSTLPDPHPTAPSRVWGVAYHIPTQHVNEVRNYLDIREINGYSIQFTPFHPTPSSPISTHITSDPTSFPPSPSPNNPSTGIQISTTISAAAVPITCLVYIGLPSNPQFAGPQDVDDLAKHILRSKGPSGENREYLFLLERGLQELGSESSDEHVRDLAARCRELERDEEVERGVEGMTVGDGEEEGIGEPLHRAGTTEEIEEVEK
ncbi:ChaC-domain-containing protein [Sporormia fimetaria CBS 119925]|uniref:glutathione-specific gamma-glutamylcyclotransferase n=1 Tax=Sporormia fimetaria CBS 119925 TaxID=1340428 RepID=A0A6A6UYP7_9PLEO|nr:ChaC-domain-containing protein [Sporormia fimetaria CBS 119925]